jgi:hypothetical protein
MNQINQINKTNQSNQHRASLPPVLVVDFSTGWWIATTSACVSSRQDISLLGNLGHYRIAMLAQALRFTYDKHR